MDYWQHTPYNSVFIIATLISVTVLLFAWRHRYRRGGRAFAAAMGIIVVWTASDALQLMAVDQSAKLLWRTIGYAAHNLGPITLLVFALQYTGREAWVTPRNIGLLALEPLLVGFVITPTTTIHGLIWTDLWLSTHAGFATLEMTFGGWYWVNTAYNYVLVLAAITLFVDMATGWKTTHRKQGVALVAGVLPPFMGNLLWVAGITAIDLTAVGFALTGVIWGTALYQFRLLDLVPVGRHAVLEDIPDGYVVLDADDRVVDLNAAARSIVGDVVGESAEEVLPVGADILDRPGDEETEADVTLTVDGRTKHYLARVSPLGSDRFLGRLLFLRDVTGEREVEHRYQALIENASDLIIVLEEDWTMRYISPSAERTLGVEPSTLEGTSVFERIHPDDANRAVEEFQRTLDDPDYEAQLEYRYRHKDGSWIWLESRGRNLVGDNPVDGVVVNSREVTARRHREETLRRQKERLDEFASVVSHDLRNPLNVISGRIELAKETGDLENLEPAIQATERMNQLVDELLTLARQGQSLGEISGVSLEDAAEEGWSMVDTHQGTLEIDDAEVRIEADRSRLSELFGNLFRNAVDHSEGAVTVRVGTTGDGFYVEDDGPGIPESERAQVFDRGYSTDSRGTGLGLAIVREIATAHDWEIDVTTGSGGGARFEITGVERRTPSVPAED